ncbi:MAG: hypothetical protein Fur0021_31130 [Candidatus Promineifilaceae bacterium]
MNPKLFIILIVILGVVFTVGIGVGIGQDDEAPPDLTDENWVESFKEWIPTSQADVDDIKRAAPSGCLNEAQQRLSISAGQTCQLTWQPAANQRVIRLRMTAGDGADLILVQTVQPDGDMLTSREEDVAVGQTVEMDIYRRQTDQDIIQLAISCHLGDACSFVFP